MLKETLRPAWAEINLSCIEHNIKEITKITGDREIIGIVKADAYGHGAVRTAEVLIRNGVSSLGVATLSEAIALRKAGIDCPIIMLTLTPWVYHDDLIEHDITPVMASYMDTRILSCLAVKAKKTVDVLLAVDTGMGRIGFLPSKNSVTEITGICRLPNIRIKGFFSDLAVADEEEKSFTKEQISKFKEFTNKAEAAGVPVGYRTIANSAAIMKYPESHLEAVRPGLVLYGCYPGGQPDKKLLNLKPAMTLKASIIYLKRVPAGYSISYGRRYVTEKESLIATLPIGYADGYPRLLTGKGRVLIHDEYAPVVGNICMDQCMVDVTHIPGIRKYDEAVLIGSQGDKCISADEIAEKTDTISYEIISRIGHRVPKVYIRDNEENPPASRI